MARILFSCLLLFSQISFAQEDVEIFSTVHEGDIYFGSFLEGNFTQRNDSAKIMNPLFTTLTINFIEVTGKGFSLVGSPYGQKVPPNATMAYPIDFKTANLKPGVYNGQVKFHMDWPNGPEIIYYNLKAEITKKP